MDGSWRLRVSEIVGDLQKTFEYKMDYSHNKDTLSLHYSTIPIVR